MIILFIGNLSWQRHEKFKYM